MTPDPHANTEQGYHTFNGTGSFEVFFDDGREEPDLFPQAGWYWWACFPGCLPDGEASGPFATSTEAVDDALGGDVGSGAP